jgi:PAS domain S-box-containing protein
MEDDEHRRLAEALRSTRERLDQVLERVTDAFIALDTDWRFTYVNRRAAEIMRRRAEDLIGRYLWAEFPETVAHPISRAYRQAAAEQAPQYIEAYFQPLDRWFEHRIFPSPEGLSAFFQDVTERRRDQERLRTLSRRLLTAQEEERRRVARELHDEVGQVLTAVKIQLQSLQRNGQSPPAGRLEDAIDSVDSAIGDLRVLAFELRPALLDDLGLAAALRWQADRCAAETGLDVALDIDPIGARLPSEVETACFRVVQEALTNVVRHAHARRITIELRRPQTDAPASLDLRIRDDGAGFEPAVARRGAAEGAGMGLAGMEERARLAGGRFELRSSPGTGTEVALHFDAVGGAE